MEVLLNKAPCEIDSEISTLLGLVAWVEEHRLPADEILVNISVNGVEVNDEEELTTTLLENGSKVELSSSRAIDLASDGLEHAAELLPGLVEELPATARELRSGDVTTGLAMFDDCISAISWYVQLVSALDVLFSPSYEATNDAASAEDLSPDTGMTELSLESAGELRTFSSVENLRQKLLEIEDGQNRQDQDALANLLEYELLPILRLWQEDLPTLLSRVRAESGQA